MEGLDYGKMDSIQYDVLKEVGNIGAGNATTALSKMIHMKVDMQVPKVEVLSFQELPDIIGGAETVVVGILVTLGGDVSGMMMFMMEQQCARKIVDQIIGMPAGQNGTEFSEMELSALQEIGNIIAGAYLSSLSSLTNLTITESVPYLSVDMAGAILSVPAIEFGKMGDQALLIQSQFLEDEVELDGYFILVPTLESSGKILASLGI